MWQFLPRSACKLNTHYTGGGRESIPPALEGVTANSRGWSWKGSFLVCTAWQTTYINTSLCTGDVNTKVTAWKIRVRNLSLLHSFAWVSSGTLCPISGTKFLGKSCQLEMWRIYCFNPEIALLQKTTPNASLNLWLGINSFSCAYPYTLSKDKYQHWTLLICLSTPTSPPDFSFSPQNRQTQMIGGKPT